LLVGKTSEDATTVGSTMRPNGGIVSVRDGDTNVVLNRKTSDGTIIDFRKDNTTVGSIGTQGGTLEVGSGDVYLQFNGTNDWIKPVDGSGSNKPNVDLGTSGARFKDLYLSGGVVFGTTGGTVSSKTLDDYEEGTWTPNLVPSNGSFTSITYSTRVGKYTKIGNIVTLSCRLNTSAITIGGGSGNVQVTNLPFNTSSASAPSAALTFNANWASGNPAFAFLLDASGTVRLHQSVAAGAYNLGTPTTVANLNTGSNSNYVYFVLTYETT